jgi:hypothetical protein
VTDPSNPPATRQQTAAWLASLGYAPDLSGQFTKGNCRVMLPAPGKITISVFDIDGDRESYWYIRTEDAPRLALERLLVTVESAPRRLAA